MRIGMQDFARNNSDEKDPCLTISGVNYYTADAALLGLRKYLAGAAVVWPELKDYEIFPQTPVTPTGKKKP